VKKCDRYTGFILVLSIVCRSNINCNHRSIGIEASEDTHNLCLLTKEVEKCILGDRVFKTGIMRSRSYKSVLALLHITRTAFLVRLATPAILPATLTPCRTGSLGKLIMCCYSYFRFLGIALYGFLQCQLILFFRTYSGKYDQLKLGSPDCPSHL
jgi:hypothetical protein